MNYIYICIHSVNPTVFGVLLKLTVRSRKRGSQLSDTEYGIDSFTWRYFHSLLPVVRPGGRLSATHFAEPWAVVSPVDGSCKKRQIRIYSMNIVEWEKMLQNNVHCSSFSMPAFVQ